MADPAEYPNMEPLANMTEPELMRGVDEVIAMSQGRYFGDLGQVLLAPLHMPPTAYRPPEETFVGNSFSYVITAGLVALSAVSRTLGKWRDNR
jgi:hypothetical protein